MAESTTTGGLGTLLRKAGWKWPLEVFSLATLSRISANNRSATVLSSQFLGFSKDRDSPVSPVSPCQSYPPFLEESEIWFLAWAPKQSMAIGPGCITCNFSEGSTKLPDIMEKFSPSPPPFWGRVPLTRALIPRETGSASYWFYLASTQWAQVHPSDGSELRIITSSPAFELHWGWVSNSCWSPQLCRGCCPPARAICARKWRQG